MTDNVQAPQFGEPRSVAHRGQRSSISRCAVFAAFRKLVGEDYEKARVDDPDYDELVPRAIAQIPLLNAIGEC